VPEAVPVNLADTATASVVRALPHAVPLRLTIIKPHLQLLVLTKDSLTPKIAETIKNNLRL
jgi:hypothetical protein